MSIYLFFFVYGPYIPYGVSKKIYLTGYYPFLARVSILRCITWDRPEINLSTSPCDKRSANYSEVAASWVVPTREN